MKTYSGFEIRNLTYTHVFHQSCHFSSERRAAEGKGFKLCVLLLLAKAVGESLLTDKQAVLKSVLQEVSYTPI